MSKDRWRHISTLKDDDALGVRNILVWNDCNGPHYISYCSDEWFRIFNRSGDGWTMWKEVSGPTQTELDVAGRTAKRNHMPPPARPMPGERA